jgi:hypothetical protein
MFLSIIMRVILAFAINQPRLPVDGSPTGDPTQPTGPVCHISDPCGPPPSGSTNP